MKKQSIFALLFFAAFSVLYILPANGQTYYIKSECGKYLTVQNLSTNSGAPIVLADFQSALAQQWKIIYRSRANGEYIFYIESVKSGKYLDVTCGKNADGTKVQLWDFTGGPAQEWTLSTMESTDFKGRCRFVSQVGGKNLDKGGGPCTNNTPLMIWTRNNTSAQMWYLEEVPPARVTQAGEKAPSKLGNKPMLTKSMRN